MTKSILEIKIINVQTGEEIVRAATADEIVEIEKREAKAKSTKAELVAKLATAQAKFAALGLTVEDLQALGL